MKLKFKLTNGSFESVMSARSCESRNINYLHELKMNKMFTKENPFR